jgi:capsular polysaccharide biosynthesis protein
MDPAPETASTPLAAGHLDLPIGEAASEVLQIESAAAIGAEFDISLGDTFTDPKHRTHFARRTSTEPLCCHNLRDVTLDASLMLLLRGRARIPETRFLVGNEDYADTLVKPLPATRMDPTVRYVIGCNRAWHNYYHWLIQAIPAIDWGLRRHGRHRLVLVLPPLRTWQEETLALLGYQDVASLTLDISGTYLFPDVEFSDFLGARMSGVASYAAAATFRRLAAAAPWIHGAADEIYVARTDAHNRVAENEAELIDFLDKQGVRIIVPGTLSVAEQIAAFRAARLVIGPHGAGMSNIAFCQPRNFVYELLPRNYANACINRIAQSVGLNYWADLFESLGPGDVQQQTWRIDLDIVAARLHAVRALIAATPRVEPAMSFLKRTQTAQPDDLTSPIHAAPPPVLASEPLHPPTLLARSTRALARLFTHGGAQQ